MQDTIMFPVEYSSLTLIQGDDVVDSYVATQNAI